MEDHYDSSFQQYQKMDDDMDDVIIKNIGELNKKEMVRIVTFGYQNKDIMLEIPTSESLDEDISAFKGWSLNVFMRYLVYKKSRGIIQRLK